MEEENRVHAFDLPSYLAVLSLGVLALIDAPRAVADEIGFLCDGCVVVGDATGEPRPLLVVLHGDEGGPSRIVAAWRSVVRSAHVTLFAPKCPPREHCVGSFWQWDGQPSWLLDQVASVEAKYPIDPKKRYLAGWSGGSTYLTFHLDAWFPTFAAVSVAGGGAPGRGSCFPRAGGACAPVHYLMGDRNPLFDLAVRAKDSATACGHDVTWELVRGADHEGEWRTYTARTGDILAWLLARSNACEVQLEPMSAAPTVFAAPTAIATPPAESTAATPRRPPPRVAPGCNCAAAGYCPGGGSSPIGLAASLAIALTLLKRRRQWRERQR